MFSFSFFFLVCYCQIAFNTDDVKDCSFNNCDIVTAAVNSLTDNFYPCAYYNINDIPLNKSNSKSLNTFHFNIRSLPKNNDLLHEFLCMLPISPEIICLSESQINHQPLSNLDLPGYKLFNNDSATRVGGVAIYVNNNICAELIPELFLDIDGCENLWLKLNDADVVISAIY